MPPSETITPPRARPRVDRLRRLLPGVQLPIWSALQAAVQMGVAVLSARWLGPGERGDLVLATTLSTLLLLVSSMGAGQASRVVLAEPGRWWTWSRFMCLGSLLVLPQILLSSTMGLVLLHRLSTADSSVAIPFIAYSATALCAYVFREGLHGLGRHRTAVAIDVASAGIQLGLIAAAHAAGILSAEVALYIGALCYVGLILVQMLIGRSADGQGRNTHPTSVRKFGYETRKFLVISRFALVAALGQSFVVLGDRLVLGAAGSSAEVGIYAAASSLAQLTWVAPVALTPVLTRRIAGEGTLRAWRNSYRPVIALTAALAVVVSCLGWIAVPVLLGEDFTAARSVLPILCAAAIPYASYHFDSAACAGLRDLRTGAVGASLGCVVLVATSTGGYFLLGTAGVAYGVLITYTAMAALSRIRMPGGRHRKTKTPERRRLPLG